MTLRIVAPRESGRRGFDGPGVTTDYYLARLVKLIPGEAVVVYPFLNSRAQQVADEARVWHEETSATTPTTATVEQPAPASGSSVPKGDPASLVVCGVAWLILAVVILLRWQATRVADGPAQWGAVFIAAVSFVLWVPVMHGSFGIFDALKAHGGVRLPDPVLTFIPELLLILWTILVPAFYRPQQ